MASIAEPGELLVRFLLGPALFLLSVVSCAGQPDPIALVCTAQADAHSSNRTWIKGSVQNLSQKSIRALIVALILTRSRSPDFTLRVNVQPSEATEFDIVVPYAKSEIGTFYGKACFVGVRYADGSEWGGYGGSV